MTLTVLQWNIWYKEDVHHIVEFLREHPADIICLQEMMINGQTQPESHSPSYIAAQLGLRSHIHEIPVVEDGVGFQQANGIFTKLPIIATNYAWVNQPTGKGGFEDEYRAYVEAKLELPDGSQLTVGTTQLSYSHQFQDTSRKLTETQALLAKIAPHTQRYLLAGDLSATPPSQTIELVSQQLTNAGPNLLEPTWTTKPFSYQGFEASTLGWRLDYVFTTPDIAVNSAQVLPTVYSDHLPILATIEL